MGNISLGWLLRSTVTMVFTLLIGAALVAFMAVLVATEVPGGTRDLDAYNAAPRCPSAPSEPSECRWTQEFTVSDVHRKQKRGDVDRATLTDADGNEWETAYLNDGPVLDGMDEGDQLTGTVWRGKVTEVAMDGDSQETDAAPVDLRARFLILALVSVPASLLIMAVCAWRLGDKWTRRSAPRDPTPAMTATLGLGLAVFAGGLFCLLVMSAFGENFWAVAAVWLPMTVIMATAARVHVVKKRTRAAAPDRPAFQ
ncbi:Uncharacterised protein [Mycobacterium tuberculosis]|nr:Uncharacterised protein [Mycobacterium tuberculosis]